jgi:predicted nuclease of predicted toxin-antitoxin system
VIKFHLDENVDHDIARGLRFRGIDVTTTEDAGLHRAPDPDHMAFGFHEGRVIVTHDVDFIRWHNHGVPHSGIVFSPQQQRSTKELLAFLILLHDAMTSEEMQGRIEFA